MAVKITRLLDGSSYTPYDDRTKIQINPDTYGSSRSSQVALGALGRAIQLSSEYEAKTFTMKIISVDEYGGEFNYLRRFFTSEDPYAIEAPEDFSLGEIWAIVTDVQQTGYATLTVSFTAYYGVDVTVMTTNLYSHDFAQSDTPLYEYVSFDAWNESWMEADGFLRFTMEAGPQAVWYPGLQINADALISDLNTGQPLGERKYFSFVTGAQGIYGDWNLTQKRKSIVVDSNMLVMGSGYFTDQINHKHEFFGVPSGTNANGTLQFSNTVDTYGPWCTEDWKFKIDLVTVGV